MTMTDYKSTLNLPITEFPMKASLAQREPMMLVKWQEEGLYQAIRAKRQGCELFVMHDGPPYANGHLHCGHALNKILKDIIVKSKILSGFDAPFVPGWDCHGLPIEINVEKKVGKSGVKIPAADFRRACRDYAASQIDIQRDEFMRLGVLGDWNNPYVTMDFHYEANILRGLAKIIANGHLQQGFKPVHWCIDCKSSLAEAEVEYEDKTSASIDVAFYVDNPQDCLDRMSVTVPVKPVIVPIWTTTPWTLPANEAVSLNPALSYSLADCGSCYMVIATELLSTVMARLNHVDYKALGSVPGLIFEGLVLKHPFEDRLVPTVLSEHVTLEAGTGCVHTAPAHGPDDYLVGLANHLPLKNPVLGHGCYAPEVPFFAGLSIRKVESLILDKLREQGTLLHSIELRHAYPHCWRHKTPTIFRATPQWFLSMDSHGLREQLLEVVADVDWIPEWGKARIESMIKTRPDWCISRQRSWGTPIPLYLHKLTRALHPDTVALIEEVAKRVEKLGIEAWFSLDPAELLGEDAADYEACTDTLDVWFDSGLSHFCVLRQPEFGLHAPADVYFEGSDQHRGWFNSSLTTAVAMYGVPPFRTVLTHGYTVDSEGKKLSKSKGNYVALDELVAQYGADILRLWVSSSDYRNELTISDEIIRRNADAYRRIRNTIRFLLSNLFDFDHSRDAVAVDEMVELDRFIIKRCQLLQSEILIDYERYHFHSIYQKIHHFCAVDLGSFYLDVIKDRQYTAPKTSVARRSCQTAMYHILHALTRWLAPILSFTADEIWQVIPGKTSSSVFLETWYQGWPDVGEVDLAQWQAIQAIRDEVNKALETQRQAGVFGSGLAADVFIYAQDAAQVILAKLKDELRFLLITSKVTVLPWSMRPEGCSAHDELGVAIVAKASNAMKCARCWHRLEDVGTHSEHAELCHRCIANISGQDEVRLYV